MTTPQILMLSIIALALGVSEGVLSSLEECRRSAAWVPATLFPSRQDPQVAQVILSAMPQFSPRILVSDRGTQWTLGVFLGTFSYCMAALPAARSLPVAFVPVLTVTGAMLLALVASPSLAEPAALTRLFLSASQKVNRQAGLRLRGTLLGCLVPASVAPSPALGWCGVPQASNGQGDFETVGKWQNRWGAMRSNRWPSCRPPHRAGKYRADRRNPPPAIASGVGRPDMRRTAWTSVCTGRIRTLPLRDTAATKASSTPGRSTLKSHRPGASSLCTIGPAARSRVPLRLYPARYWARRCNAVARARSGSPLTQVCTEKPAWVCRISTAPSYETTVSGLASSRRSHGLCGRIRRGRCSSSRTARPVLPRSLAAALGAITPSDPAMCACRAICARNSALPISMRCQAAACGGAIGHRRRPRD